MDFMTPDMMGMSPAGGGMVAPGQPPFGGGNPSAALSALSQLAKSPPKRGYKEALDEATAKLQVALMRIYLLNPRAAKLVADALSKVQQAQSELAKEGPGIGSPPNLLGSGSPMGSGVAF